MVGDRSLPQARCLARAARRFRQPLAQRIPAAPRSATRHTRLAGTSPPPAHEQRPELFLASPVPAGATSAPHLLLNALPFMEDLRDYRFPSFTKKSWWVGGRGGGGLGSRATANGTNGTHSTNGTKAGGTLAEGQAGRQGEGRAGAAQAAERGQGPGTRQGPTVRCCAWRASRLALPRLRCREPSEAQVEAAAALVASMSLGQGGARATPQASRCTRSPLLEAGCCLPVPPCAADVPPSWSPHPHWDAALCCPARPPGLLSTWQAPGRLTHRRLATCLPCCCRRPGAAAAGAHPRPGTTPSVLRMWAEVRTGGGRPARCGRQSGVACAALGMPRTWVLPGVCCVRWRVRRPPASPAAAPACRACCAAARCACCRVADPEAPLQEEDELVGAACLPACLSVCVGGGCGLRHKVPLRIGRPQPHLHSKAKPVCPPRPPACQPCLLLSCHAPARCSTHQPAPPIPPHPRRRPAHPGPSPSPSPSPSPACRPARCYCPTPTACPGRRRLWRPLPPPSPRIRQPRPAAARRPR